MAALYHIPLQHHITTLSSSREVMLRDFDSLQLSLNLVSDLIRFSLGFNSTKSCDSGTKRHHQYSGIKQSMTRTHIGRGESGRAGGKLSTDARQTGNHTLAVSRANSANSTTLSSTLLVSSFNCHPLIHSYNS